jgi:hypothetical protein
MIPGIKNGRHEILLRKSFTDLVVPNPKQPTDPTKRLVLGVSETFELREDDGSVGGRAAARDNPAKAGDTIVWYCARPFTLLAHSLKDWKFDPEQGWKVLTFVESKEGGEEQDCREVYAINSVRNEQKSGEKAFCLELTLSPDLPPDKDYSVCYHFMIPQLVLDDCLPNPTRNGGMRATAAPGNSLVRATIIIQHTLNQ